VPIWNAAISSINNHQSLSPEKTMTSLRTTFVLGLSVLAIGFAGCAQDTEETAANGPETSGPPATVDTHEGHDHAHPSEGPHHGDLVELGNEEYHAEVVHDEDKNVLEIYILDSSATKQVAIEATQLSINLTHDGRPEQFTLTAQADEHDEAGKSSRFVSFDVGLAEHLDEEGADPRLVVDINGKSYRGEISHDHDHEGHDHEH